MYLKIFIFSFLLFISNLSFASISTYYGMEAFGANMSAAINATVQYFEAREAAKIEFEKFEKTVHQYENRLINCGHCKDREKYIKELDELFFTADILYAYVESLEENFGDRITTMYQPFFYYGRFDKSSRHEEGWQWRKCLEKNGGFWWKLDTEKLIEVNKACYHEYLSLKVRRYQDNDAYKIADKVDLGPTNFDELLSKISEEDNQRRNKRLKDFAFQQAQHLMILEDDIWIDPETSLMWLLNSEGNNVRWGTRRVNWEKANSYCQNFRFNNHNDWSLPSFEQLQSLGIKKKPKRAPYFKKQGYFVQLLKGPVSQNLAPIEYWTDNRNERAGFYKILPTQFEYTSTKWDTELTKKTSTGISNGLCVRKVKYFNKEYYPYVDAYQVRVRKAGINKLKHSKSIKGELTEEQLNTYRSWIQNAGFKVVWEEIRKTSNEKSNGIYDEVSAACNPNCLDPRKFHRGIYHSNK